MLHTWHGMDQSVSDNATDNGVDIFAHVWEQTLDILSNYCDNIHSAIWMKLNFLIFNFILQIWTFKFSKVWWEIIHRFYWKFT